jgi:hypothetical protein
MAAVRPGVEEMQGLYGPFTLTERVLQRIWLRQDFAADRAELNDGRALAVEHPGRWNLLGGPDFLGARLRFAGRAVDGDVEVHFRVRDWRAHGHAANPAFGRVGLHVLLHPPDPEEAPARRADGEAIPSVALLPLLHRSLEEYAADDALEALTARDAWRRFEELAVLPDEVRRRTLAAHAADRWARKVGYARRRIDRLGWEAAAHQTALEILGYRRNRVPMLAAAEHFPLPGWRSPETPDAAWRGVFGWRRDGVRPANRPETRLAQYGAWVRTRPDWPEDLKAWAQNLPPGGGGWVGSTREFRRTPEWGSARGALAELCGGVVGGTRFDTLVCDGLLPMAAAGAGRPDLDRFWHHWPVGDLPDAVVAGLRRLGPAGVGREPRAHGFGQGLIGWLLERGALA